MSARRAMALAVLVIPMIAAGAIRSSSRNLPSAPGIADRDTTGCLDTLHASDSVFAVIKMNVRPQDRKTKLPPDFEGLFVQEFRSRLKLPRNLPLSVMVGRIPCDTKGGRCAGGVMMFGSHAYATVQPTGALSRIRVVDFSLTPVFAEGVRAALENMGKEKMAPFLTGQDSIPLEIGLGVEQDSDTVPAYRHLFRVRLPYYAVPFTYSQWPKNAKGPRYPPVAERHGVQDSIFVRFTTLPDGTVAPQSVDLRAGQYREFVIAVLERLATARYVPARIGSCPVATWTAQSFTFRIR